jgi:hypothetical protein
MPDLLVPANVSSITFATSGIKAVASRKVTNITAAEYNELLKYERQPTVSQTRASGNVDIQMRDGQITNITINAVAYPVTAGIVADVPPLDAAAFLKSDNNMSFNRG